MITIYDIALRCGVSPSTVSKVINNYDSIPETTKEKVQQAMKELDYIPNSSAKYLSKGSSNNVGILSFFGTSITPFKHPLFTDILDHFQSEMNKNKYDLLFVSRMVVGKSATFYKNCISRHVDGVLMFGEMANEEMKEVIESDIPSVGFDYVGDKMPGVYSDNYNLMFRLTEHLIRLGHKNIVYIAGDINPITAGRVEGFKGALSKHGVKFYNDMVIQSKYVDFEDIELITADLLKRKYAPTAIMYPDDYSASRAISILNQKGYRCPEDISITGFDGIEIGQIIKPRLTTAKQDTKKIGTMLAKKLIAMMNNKKSPIESTEIPGTIIIGDSTGDVKN